LRIRAPGSSSEGPKFGWHLHGRRWRRRGHAALREPVATKRITTICHDLTDDTRQGLIDGVLDFVIHQPREVLAIATVRALKNAVADLAHIGSDAREADQQKKVVLSKMPAQIIIPIELYTVENI
jgi:ABC-type sugar transport system substrate-binding protein